MRILQQTLAASIHSSNREVVNGSIIVSFTEKEAFKKGEKSQKESKEEKVTIERRKRNLLLC